MFRIEEKTVFEAPIEVVFDAERDISLHAETQAHRGERAVDGVTSGLIEAGQEVEWEARHFGIRQRLRVKITTMKRPDYFRNKMVSGIFKTYSHEHIFKSISLEITIKHDIMLIEAPFDIYGRLAEVLFLERYMRRFILRKNRDLKALVEARYREKDSVST